MIQVGREASPTSCSEQPQSSNWLFRALSNQFLKSPPRETSQPLCTLLWCLIILAVFFSILYIQLQTLLFQIMTTVSPSPVSTADPHPTGTGMLIHAQSCSCSWLVQTHPKACFCRGSALALSQLPPLNFFQPSLSWTYFYIFQPCFLCYLD